jgi:hypothetical protein
MRAGAIKQELESYGISTKAFLEKSELVAALVQARKDGATASSPTSSDATSTSNTSKTVTEASTPLAPEEREEKLNKDESIRSQG